MLHFSHLLVEQKGKYFYENEDIRRTHEVLDTINCFSNIGVEYRSVFPIKIKTRPCVIILRRKADITTQTRSMPSPSLQPTLAKLTTSSIEVDNFIPTSNTANFKIDGHSDQLNVKNDDSAEVTKDNDEENNENADENMEEDTDDIDETETAEDTADVRDINNADDMENDENPNQYNDDEQIIVETDLKRPTRETKLKLKKLIEKHYRAKAARLPPNDQTDLAAAIPNRPSIRSNIKQIIKKEKIKEVIERISQIDLRTVCDLERESTKQCLLKVIDSYID